MARNRSQAPVVAPDANGPRLILLLVVLALTLLGFVMIYSASSISAITEESGQASYLVDQLVFAAIGIVAALVLWKLIPYRFWAGPAVWVIWGVAVVLLLSATPVKAQDPPPQGGLSARSACSLQSSSKSH